MEAPRSSEIAAVLAALSRAAATLPDPGLTPAEVSVRAGVLFRGCDEFVRAVARRLARNRGLFPEVPLDPAALRERQERAFLYRELHRSLVALAARAFALYVCEESEAVRDAMAVVWHVRNGARTPFVDRAAQEQREDAIAPAEALLGARKQKPLLGLRRWHREKREQKEEPVSAPE